MNKLLLLLAMLLVLPGCLKTETVDPDNLLPWVAEDATKACSTHRGMYRVTKRGFQYSLDCTDGSVFTWQETGRRWYPELEK